MGIQEKILEYLSAYGKKDKFKLARALKTDVAKVTNALDLLREGGSIEIKEGRAILIKGKKPISKPRKQKKQKVEVKEQAEEVEEKEKEVPEEEKKEDFEEKTEEIPEQFGVKEEEERVEGTVKFYNPNKGFGFITGDDEKEYYVHESGLKEGVTIEADDRVSFKIVQGDKGPKAEEVENLTQSGGQFRRTDQEHDQNAA